MCRHLAYLGAPCAVAPLLTEGSASLLTQSYAPREMRGGGTINADGWGAAWWDRDGAAHRYRSAAPLWSDVDGRAALGSVRSSAVLAAVRSATVGMPVTSSACAPFTDGHWAFSHNGVVQDWPGSVAPLAAELPVTALVTLDAPTDSALLWALLAHRLRAGQGPADAVAELVLAVEQRAPGSRLNLVLSDGEQVVATAWYHSLHVRSTADDVLVASEPLDSTPENTTPENSTPAWQLVPDHHLVTARPGQLTLTPLDPPT